MEPFAHESWPLPLFQLLAIFFSTLLLVLIVEAARRNMLNLRYALLWLAAGFALLVLSVFRPLLHTIARWLDVSYPPSLLFFLAFVFLLLIVLHYSLVISGHRNAIRKLGQAIAFLDQELRELRTTAGEKAGPRQAESGRRDEAQR